ncbi:tRNA 2-thiocytidine biosynthesis TtcA family protein [Ruminococcaceae bacterium OttesenSCG-928-L11]|nr:tRNA 2-thiocytidine biosynthesis TtcA family protein [Ruminococcaceae bacterium OttesenSCG-928-L11]
MIRKAVDEYEMIAAGDRIAVGVSGGKDSVALLAGLCKLRRFYPKPFDLVAVTVDPCFDNRQTDYSPIQTLCDQHDIPYVIRRSELGTIIFEERQESNPCSLCARMRRGMLHDMARETHCNKIALGHNYDDAVETFLMNLFNEGRIGCFQPVTWLSRKELTMIRPLIFAPERTVRNIVARNSLPIVKSKCPVDGKTNREEMKQWIEQMEKSRFPDLGKLVFGAIRRGHVDGW